MKQSMLILAIICALSLLFSSCRKVVGSGPTISETRSASGFDAISLCMDAEVTIQQDSAYSVEVRAQQNIMDEIKTDVSGSTLTIKHRNNVWIKSDPIYITIHTPNLNTLDVSGSGKIQTLNTIQTGSFSADVSGSGTIVLSGLNSTNANFKISGSGEVQCKSGTVSALITDISGSGAIYTQYMLAQRADCETSGSGTTKVWVEKNLKADISGSGDVYYRGNPIVETHISGSGKVQHID